MVDEYTWNPVIYLHRLDLQSNIWDIKHAIKGYVVLSDVSIIVFWFLSCDGTNVVFGKDRC